MTVVATPYKTNGRGSFLVVVVEIPGSGLDLTRLGHEAVRVLSQLQLPKGQYQIRAAVGGDAIAGSVVYDIEIPDFGHDDQVTPYVEVYENRRRPHAVTFNVELRDRSGRAVGTQSTDIPIQVH